LLVVGSSDTFSILTEQTVAVVTIKKSTWTCWEFERHGRRTSSAWISK